MLHCYTGDGKGKTSAAFGMALRAIGAGKRVLIGQLMKGVACHECRGLLAVDQALGFEQLTLIRKWDHSFILHRPSPAQQAMGIEVFDAFFDQLQRDCYDLAILDEAFPAHSLGVLPGEALETLVATRPGPVELILTGRNAPPAILDKADLVTVMEPVRHYFDRGVTAREGIDF